MPKVVLGPRYVPPYNEDFKRKVANAAFHRTESQTIADIAREYDVSRWAVTEWTRFYEGSLSASKNLPDGDDSTIVIKVPGLDYQGEQPERCRHRLQGRYDGTRCRLERFHTRPHDFSVNKVPVVDLSDKPQTLVDQVKELADEYQRLATALYEEKAAHSADNDRLVAEINRLKLIIADAALKLKVIRDEITQ